uniref:Arginase n=1 Tax=Photinus pyralis TaxID=7054 RepID=A0A1Y1N303_PHOPY
MFNRVSVRLLRQVRNASLKTEIGVIGVPFENGQRKVGVGNAPKFLRDAGLIKSLQKIHDKIDVKDYGDIVYSIDHDISNSVPNMLMYEHMVACTKVLSKQVTRVLNDGRICLTLGGDHSIGTFARVSEL